MLRIVVVDDNPADVNMIRFALNELRVSFDIISFSDGFQAIQYFSANRRRPPAGGCDFVVLDLNLPRVSGFEVLEFLKTDEQLKALPVMVMSGSNEPSEIQRCRAAGVDSYACKPTSLDDMLATVAQVVDCWQKNAALPSF